MVNGQREKTTERLPPGQQWVAEFVEYSAGGRPSIDETAWRLRIEGLVEDPLELDLPGFSALPHVESVSDFHCVTAWSIRDATWRGVRLAGLIERAGPKPEAAAIYVECYGGYTTNFPLAIALKPDVLLADSYNGNPLEHRFGGPVRLVVPSLYAYKSAKWVSRIVVLSGDRKGFWEERGYSNRADPWKEQRYASDDA